jgi:hypothetical protein
VPYEQLLEQASREARARRAVRRHGYSLVKSRYATTRGTYGIVGHTRNAGMWITYGGSGNGYGMSLEEIEDWIAAADDE